MSYEISAEPLEYDVPLAKAAIASYRVEIGGDEVSYHWHPTGSSRVITPHMHIVSAMRLASNGKPIGELHLPTGMVSLAAIVKFLIEELGVEPNRPDWERILTRIETER